MKKFLIFIVVTPLHLIRFLLEHIINFLLYTLNFIKIHVIPNKSFFNNVRTRFNLPGAQIHKSINIYNTPENIKKSYDYFLEDEYKNSYNHFKKYFYTSFIVHDRFSALDYAIKKSLSNFEKDNLYLEFGVFMGKSINYTAEKLADVPIYGFDGFEGLKEDWMYAQKGRFDLNKKIPKLNSNVLIVKGWVQDTLSKFLEDNNSKKINYVHLDVDTYSSTKFVLEKIKPYLKNKCIIIFDELYNYAGWRYGTYKALIEVFSENEYKYLCFNTGSFGPVVIEYNKETQLH